MTLFKETYQSLTGVFRFARFDAQGATLINASEQGFWRSYFAALLLAPVFLMLVSLDYADLIPEIGSFRFYSLELIGYVISWVLFPLVMVSMTRALGWWPYFFGFGAAHNWASVLRNLIVIFISVVTLNMPERVAGPLAIAALLYIVAFDWFVARRMLAVSGLAAAGVVAIDIALALFLEILVNMSLGV